MYKILCLSTGSEICWPKEWVKMFLLVKLVPKNIQSEMEDSVLGSNTTMLFHTQEAADWFIRRRLSYNEKRTDYQKLQFMNSVFEASDIGPELYTKKHMFEIMEVLND